MKHVTSHSPQELAERPFPATPFLGSRPVKFGDRGLPATPSSFPAELSMPEPGTPNQESVTRVKSSGTNVDIDENAAETHVPAHSPDQRVS